MLHRIAAEESETDTIHSQVSTTTSESEKLPDLGDRVPSMASVYGNGGGSSSRSSSPTGSKSGFHLPFRKRSGSSSDLEKKKKEDGLARWMSNGTVVYKSVGLGLMDLVVGNHLVKIAREKNIGTQVPGF